MFADAEAVLTTYLREALLAAGVTDVFVGTDLPNPRRPRMLLVRRDGGVAPDRFRDRPRVSFRVYDDEATVSGLLSDVRDLVARSPGYGPVRAVRESGGPLRVPDAEHAVRLFTYDLTLRGVAP